MDLRRGQVVNTVRTLPAQFKQTSRGIAAFRGVVLTQKKTNPEEKRRAASNLLCCAVHLRLRREWYGQRKNARNSE